MTLDPLLERIADALSDEPTLTKHEDEDAPGGVFVRVDFGDGLVYDVSKEQAKDAATRHPGTWRHLCTVVAREKLRESYRIPRAET